MPQAPFMSCLLHFRLYNCFANLLLSMVQAQNSEFPFNFLFYDLCFTNFYGDTGFNLTFASAFLGLRLVLRAFISGDSLPELTECCSQMEDSLRIPRTQDLPVWKLSHSITCSILPTQQNLRITRFSAPKWDAGLRLVLY